MLFPTISITYITPKIEDYTLTPEAHQGYIKQLVWRARLYVSDLYQVGLCGELPNVLNRTGLKLSLPRPVTLKRSSLSWLLAIRD
jgi:hypothetical protein